jgi:hypothetical protein
MSKPTDDPGTCRECGSANEWQKKFNSGNPGWFALPTCTCEEEETERLFIERMKNRSTILQNRVRDRDKDKDRGGMVAD